MSVLWRASACASDAMINAWYGDILLSTREVKLTALVTSRKRLTIALSTLSAVGSLPKSYVSGNRKPSIDLVLSALPSLRLYHSAGTPSLAGSAAAALSWSTGIL